eukprot:1502840-Alexandrium_andersonii.AAC.1
MMLALWYPAQDTGAQIYSISSRQMEPGQTIQTAVQEANSYAEHCDKDMKDSADKVASRVLEAKAPPTTAEDSARAIGAATTMGSGASCNLPRVPGARQRPGKAQ